MRKEKKSDGNPFVATAVVAIPISVYELAKKLLGFGTPASHSPMKMNFKLGLNIINGG
jgi:hypothetical protein